MGERIQALPHSTECSDSPRELVADVGVKVSAHGIGALKFADDFRGDTTVCYFGAGGEFNRKGFRTRIVGCGLDGGGFRERERDGHCSSPPGLSGKGRIALRMLLLSARARIIVPQNGKYFALATS